VFRPVYLGIVAGLLLATGAAAGDRGVPSRPAGRLDWRVTENRVSAQIDGWTLDRTLEAIAAATRWQVFVDPSAEHRVHAKFAQLPPGEALRRLLGSLNYALIPADAAPPRLYVFRNARSAATQRIEGPIGRDPRGRRIDDELIVRLDRDSQESIEELAQRLGATIVARSDELGAYRLKFTDAEAAALARRELEGQDGGARVDANYLVERPDAAGASLPLAGPGLNLTARPTAPGEGVVVAVVDTAIQGDAAGINDFLLPGVSVAGPASLPGEGLAHGTSMAATFLRGLSELAGESEGTSVRVLPVDVYGDRPSATTFDIALGIHAAISRGADIVNLSLGGDEESPFLRDLIRAGREQGVVFLAAAGNEPVTAPTFPAAYPEVIAVTALNRRGEVAPYANYGGFVDVGAPGVSYVSFWGQPYVVVGTSPATANASALAASIAAASAKRGVELEAEIRRALAVDPAALAPAAPGQP
jgi:hypothetical protein